ncbi:MAG: hypothetical protein ABII26_01230 [Pseudomonadota bacterium]
MNYPEASLGVSEPVIPESPKSLRTRRRAAYPESRFPLEFIPHLMRGGDDAASCGELNPQDIKQPLSGDFLLEEARP